MSGYDGYGSNQPWQAETGNLNDLTTRMMEQDHRNKEAWRTYRRNEERRRQQAEVEAYQNQMFQAESTAQETYEAIERIPRQRQSQDPSNAVGQVSTSTQQQPHRQYNQQYQQQDRAAQYMEGMYTYQDSMVQDRQEMEAEQSSYQPQEQQAHQQQAQWAHDPHQHAAATHGQYHQQDDAYEDGHYEDDGHDDGYYEDDGHDDGYSAHGQTSHHHQQSDADWHDTQHHRRY